MQDQLSSVTDPERSMSSPVYGLAIPLLVAILTLVFWDSAVLYPLKILVVLFHELSHGLAAWADMFATPNVTASSRRIRVCGIMGPLHIPRSGRATSI